MDSVTPLQALVGEVADKLMEHNLLDSTYILYTSDHGFHLGEMSMPYFKCQPYDTDIRVPFMIRGPGIRPGRTLTEFGLNVDIAPTIADLV
jgi:N-acetylglucosamine-6-sulfatase